LKTKESIDGAENDNPALSSVGWLDIVFDHLG
jgi:hypothetical protein